MDTLHIQMLFDSIDKSLRKFRNLSLLLWADHYKQVRTNWIRTQHIHSDDIEFLKVLDATEFDKLKHKAFMWGEWYDLTPKKVEYYNLYNNNRAKQVKRCKHPVIFR